MEMKGEMGCERDPNRPSPGRQTLPSVLPPTPSSPTTACLCLGGGQPFIEPCRWTPPTFLERFCQRLTMPSGGSGPSSPAVKGGGRCPASWYDNSIQGVRIRRCLLLYVNCAEALGNPPKVLDRYSPRLAHSRHPPP